MSAGNLINLCSIMHANIETITLCFCHYRLCLLLKNRVLKPKATAVSSRATIYKSWTEEKMQLAYNAVVHNGLSVRQAVEEYGVPRSTLGDRVNGRKMLGCKSGPPRILTDE